VKHPGLPQIGSSSPRSFTSEPRRNHVDWPSGTNFLDIVVRFWFWGSSRARIVFGRFTSLLKPFETAQKFANATNIHFTVHGTSFCSSFLQTTETERRTTVPIELRVGDRHRQAQTCSNLPWRARRLPVASPQSGYLVATPRSATVPSGSTHGYVCECVYVCYTQCRI